MSNMQMKKQKRWMAAALLAMNISPAWAQSDEHAGHAPPPAAPAAEMKAMDHGAMTESPKETGAMPGMDHSGHAPAPAATGMEAMDHGAMKGMDHGAMQGMDHGAMTEPPKDSGATPTMDHSGHGAMQHEPALPELRDPHAYSGGYDFSQFPMRHEEHAIMFGLVRVDRFERVRGGDNTLTTYDLQASYGGSFNRAVLKAEGDIEGGELDEASSELLWSSAVTAFWNTQLGVRYDSGMGPERSWLAFGVQGVAPYWFEVDATVYVGAEGRSALSVEAEYELLLTQKLILQPRVEANVYGKDDTARGIGSGLSDLALGIRLRYEIRRELAPYIGIEWKGTFGGTADDVRAAGEDAKQTQAVAGIRFWF